MASGHNFRRVCKISCGGIFFCKFAIFARALLAMMLIGNIITGTVWSQPTYLQVALREQYPDLCVGVCDRDTVKHCIYDNCDAEILSPNCKRCFHCLAMIMAQVRSPSISSPAELDPMQKTNKRQPMQDRSKPVKYVVQQVTYNGPKKPLMTPRTSCPLRTSSIAISFPSNH